MDEVSKEVVAEAAKEVAVKAYEDGLRPVVKEAGSVLGTLVGFFRTLCAPLERYNAASRMKTEVYIKNLEKRVLAIPEESRQEAPINILGPTIEALKYNLDEKELREMFTNLLTNSMDKRISSKCHPSYVDIIKQMSDKDAIILKSIYYKYGQGNAQAGRVRVNKKETSQYYTILPEWIIEENIESCSIFDISKSLIHLAKLGLLELMYDRTLTKKESKLPVLYKKEEVVKIFNKQLEIDKDIELGGTDCIYHINDFGADFAEVVL